MEIVIYIIGVLIIIGFVEYKDRKLAQKLEKANEELLSKIFKPNTAFLVDENQQMEVYENETTKTQIHHT